MLNANIVQESKIKEKRRAVYETLTADERETLRNKTIGHGNMAKCEDATEMTRNTIGRALAGSRILPEKAVALRLYLAGLPANEQAVKDYLAAQSQTPQQ